MHNRVDMLVGHPVLPSPSLVHGVEELGLTIPKGVQCTLAPKPHPIIISPFLGTEHIVITPIAGRRGVEHWELVSVLSMFVFELRINTMNRPLRDAHEQDRAYSFSEDYAKVVVVDLPVCFVGTNDFPLQPLASFPGDEAPNVILGHKRCLVPHDAHCCLPRPLDDIFLGCENYGSRLPARKPSGTREVT